MGVLPPRVRRALSPGMRRVEHTRRRLARLYLHGSGIEIGALHMPLWIPPGVTVRYVDRLDLDGLRGHYPELAGERLVAPDVVDDGEALTLLPEASADFVIANHFIEHTEDPIATLLAHARVLRDGGTLFMAVPDRGAGVDVAREGTSWEHLTADHREGAERSRAAHYEEWARLVDARLGNIDPEDVAAHAAMLQERAHSIHFHAWSPEEFAAFVRRAGQEFGLPLELVEVVPNLHEFIVIARRAPRAVSRG